MTLRNENQLHFKNNFTVGDFFYSDLDQVEPVHMTVDTYTTWIFTDYAITNKNENII